ncbi:adenosylhomocysteinase [Streptomyces sp. BK340]|uniref:adenosylhomocysteinase n=1 Tax=Streptomyces sp. BK340 TaxID=2572903 RepID=UPI0011ADF045|nr:adenosylhomocysteinase [Streptomyces sp. BK340]TVZ84921.1 S-adenosyl-L-homocysteine hydrolase [Streptomyces sp. BK340]
MTSSTTPSVGPDASARKPHTFHNDRRTDPDFRGRDFSLAAQGRNAIRLAEHEMPVLMALRACYAVSAPLARARITGTVRTTVQRTVLIETLVQLGAQVRWTGSNVLPTQDPAAAAVAAGPGGDRLGVPVFTWKRQGPDEFWWCVDQALSWLDGDGPTILLDDAACCTVLLDQGVEMTGPAAMPHVTVDGEDEYFEMRRFAGNLVVEGCFVPPMHNWFLSAAHGEDAIEEFLAHAGRAMSGTQEELVGL